MKQEEIIYALGKNGVLRNMNVIQFYAEELYEDLERDRIPMSEVPDRIDYILDEVSDLYGTLENIRKEIEL